MVKILCLREITTVLQSTTYSLQGCTLIWESKKIHETEEASRMKGETSSIIQESSAVIYNHSNNPQMIEVSHRKDIMSLRSNIGAKPNEDYEKCSGEKISICTETISYGGDGTPGDALLRRVGILSEERAHYFCATF